MRIQIGVQAARKIVLHELLAGRYLGHDRLTRPGAVGSIGPDDCSGSVNPYLDLVNATGGKSQKLEQSGTIDYPLTAQVISVR